MLSLAAHLEVANAKCSAPFPSVENSHTEKAMQVCMLSINNKVKSKVTDHSVILYPGSAMITLQP